MLIKKINDDNNERMRFKSSKQLSVMRNPDFVAVHWYTSFLLLDRDPQQNARPDRNTRPNSALEHRRRCTSSMCEKSICKIQIYRNEIRLHPNFAM